MNPSMAYDAILVKINYRKSRLFKNLDWEKLIECNTVLELKEQLTNNEELSKVMKSLSNESIDRNSLEAALGKFKTLETENLLNYFIADYKEFVIALLVESEIKDLSLVLRKIARSESLQDIEDRFTHSKRHKTLPFDKLVNSKTVFQFTENLKGTPYYAQLRNLTNEDAITREFHIEMKSYIEYYRNLTEKAQKLDNLDRNTAMEIIGLKIDLLNVQWIYRALNFYKISKEEILIYSLNGGSTIDNPKLKELCNSKSTDEFKKKVNSFLKKDIFSNDDDVGIDLIVNKYLYNYINKKKTGSIGVVVSYMYLLDFLVEDITTILEGINYKLDKDNIKKYLVRSM